MPVADAQHVGARAFSCALLSAVAGALVVCAPLRAMAAGGDTAAAQALFEEGKRAMQAHDYASACPKLVESLRLDPAGGTAFAVALCHEALAIARRDHRPDREAAALARSAALERRLVKLRVTVQGDEPGLEILRDGAAVGRAQWGVDVPADPGSHVFEARAPGRTPWHGAVRTGAEGSTVSVTIPALIAEATAPVAVAPPAPASLPVVAAAVPAPLAARPPAEEGSSWSAGKTWSVVAGGVGLVGVALGAGFGVAASSKWSGAQTACPHDLCTSMSDQESGSSAGHLADVSTVAFTLGGVALGLAAVLFFTAPSAGGSTQAARLRLTGGPGDLGLGVGGAL